MSKRIKGAVLAMSVLLSAVPAFAEAVTYHADLSAANEVPPTGTEGTGHLTATFDTMTKELTYKVEYDHLTGPATMAHFHGPAPKGTNAAVAVPITGALASPIAGKATLTDAQAKALTDGMMYFNIHTDAHKPGEIRGQVENGM